MSKYFSVVTNIGRAKIAAALANNATLGLKSVAVGDGGGNPVTPAADMLGLVREVYRTDLSALSVDPLNANYMIAEAVIPTSEGGWTVREVGLFDTDGNLIVIANYAPSYKPVIAEGSGRDMIVRLYIQVEEAETAALTLSIDPTVAVASRQWVTANFLLSVQLPDGLTGQILRKRSNADGDVEWYDPLSGLNVLVDCVEEEQELANGQDVVNLVTAGTAGAAVYIDGARLAATDWAANSSTQLTLGTPAVGGEKIIVVQNEPAAGAAFLNKSENLGDLPNPAVARTNLGTPTVNEAVAAVLDALYPVGEVLTTLRAGAPDTWAGPWSGFGTWERYAPGRTLVGYDSTDADFNAVSKQGGEKKHLLSVAEMPAHRHRFISPNVNNGSALYAEFNLGEQAWIGPNGSTNGPLYQGDSEAQGGNVPHNNLQPYSVVFFWRRTA